MEQDLSNLIFDNVSDEIMLINAREYTVERVNRAMLDSLKQKDEVIGKRCYEITHDRSSPCDSPEHPCPLKTVMETGKSVTVEHTHYTNNGANLFVNIHAIPINNPKEITHILYLSQNVTEHKEVEERLQDSEKMLHLISENSRDIICLHDSNHRYVFVSSACKEILGYEPEELIGRNPWELVYSEDLEVLQRSGQEMVSENSFGLLTYRIRKKSGDYVWFESVSRTIMDDVGDIKGFVTSSRDITERKQMEHVLRISEEQYRKLINTMNDAAWVISLDGKFLEVNEAVVKVLGYSKEEMFSKYAWDIDASLSCEEIKQLLEKIPNEKYQVFETTQYTKDGKTVPVEISASLVDYRGKQAILSVTRNISDRKQMEQELMNLVYRLNDVEAGECYVSDSRKKCLNVFVYSVVHGRKGLFITRRNPVDTTKEYGLDAESVMLLSSTSIGDFKTVGNLQEVSLEISMFLESGGEIVLLEGLEYLVSRFDFDPVYNMLQEKRFQFLDAGTVLLVPINFDTLTEQQKALLQSELKTIQ